MHRSADWAHTRRGRVLTKVRDPLSLRLRTKLLILVAMAVFAKGTKVVLWRKNWRVLRRGATLAVEPLEPGGEYRDSDQGRRPRRYRTEG